MSGMYHHIDLVIEPKISFYFDKNVYNGLQGQKKE